jgi:hypothetical protein
MGEESTNPRSGADAKGSSRIRNYEKRKAAKEAVDDPTIKITTFWEKIGKDGSWEEKEYHQKIKEDIRR